MRIGSLGYARNAGLSSNRSFTLGEQIVKLLLQSLAGVLALASVAGPTAAATPATQPSKLVAKPLSAVPMDARIYWMSGDIAVSDSYQARPKDRQVLYTFYWNLENVAGADTVRWQIATEPFPAYAGGKRSDFSPPGLLADGEGNGKRGYFTGDFRKLLGSRSVDSLYVRVLPLPAAGAKTVAGAPSNVIRVYYSGRMPTGPELSLPPPVPAKQTPDLYRVKLIGFTPADFFDPNRWGCVVVTGYQKAPQQGLDLPRDDNFSRSAIGAIVAPRAFGATIQQRFPLGAQICPEAYRGRGEQIDSFGDFLKWAANGIKDAFNWIAGAYNDLKATVVNTILEVTQACNIIGVAGKGAASTCRTVASAAADAGMLALGIPPSIPNFDQLVDEGLDSAVEFAASAIATQTGVPCLGPCRKLLRKSFLEAADTMKSTAFSPGCVGAEEAHQYGREPLCLPAEVITKPAPHSIDVPPIARVEIVRNRRLADFDHRECRLYGKIDFRNEFPGDRVSGPTPRTSKFVRRQPIRGELYSQPDTTLPVMGFGQKLVMPLTFGHEIRHEFPWTRELWSRSQIPSPDAQHPRGPDWFQLYFGAKAEISVWSDCSRGGESKLKRTMPKQ